MVQGPRVFWAIWNVLAVASALVKGVLVVPAAGKGNKWNVTDGWESTCWSSASKGNLPCSSLFRVVMRSAMSTQAARSARNSWAKETDE